MIGKSFSQLGQAMEGDGGNYNPGLNNAVIATGNSFSSLTWLRLIMCFRWVLRGDRSTIRRAAAPRLGAHRRHDARLQGPAGWVASSPAHPLGEFSLWRLSPKISSTSTWLIISSVCAGSPGEEKRGWGGEQRKCCRCEEEGGCSQLLLVVRGDLFSLLKTWNYLRVRFSKHINWR